MWCGMQSFIQAFRAGCEGKTPAKIVVPPGKFMMGEVILRGKCKAPPPLIIDIQGTILANPDPSTYTNRMWILLEYLENVKVGGGGTLNGQGANVWKYAGENNKMPVVSIYTLLF